MGWSSLSQSYGDTAAPNVCLACGSTYTQEHLLADCTATTYSTIRGECYKELRTLVKEAPALDKGAINLLIDMLRSAVQRGRLWVGVLLPMHLHRITDALALQSHPISTHHRITQLLWQSLKIVATHGARIHANYFQASNGHHPH